METSTCRAGAVLHLVRLCSMNTFLVRVAPLACAALLATLGACTHVTLPRSDPIPVDAALSMQLTPAVRALDSAIANGAAPGAVLAVSLGGRHFEHAIGQLAVDDPRPP